LKRKKNAPGDIARIKDEACIKRIDY